jgi:CO/xanthine dehydrogenase FAD-binding subunit
VRSWLAQYEMRSVASLKDALDLLATDPGAWTPFAGGTDLMVLLEAGRLPQRRFLDLWRVPELHGITHTPDEVVIGALATYTDLLRDPVITSEFPLVAEAARVTGATAIQNRGTVGGNIANASPAADLPPALLVYDAWIELVSTSGSRRVPYREFHTGYKAMDLAPAELIRGVSLPRGELYTRQTYRKVGTRRAQAISKLCFAAGLVADDRIREVRIALGSVAPTVVRARHAEEVLRGRSLDAHVIAEARAALSHDIAPIDDVRSTADYRLKVAGNLLEEFLS